MSFRPDPTLYPDVPPPASLDSLGDRIDYLARLCAAWDFGHLPDPRAVAEIRRPGWRAAVEATELLTSHTYHLLREWHRLPEAPYLGTIPAFVRDDPSLGFV